ncbi:alpha/beta hydrolase family protein [Nocardia callitridis]|uniref:Alpha/beta hydrolase family protein n=1 Tax=Nocardia callitridis TaxID=648753 RepID=A0ABP9KR05_9NOCA
MLLTTVLLAAALGVEPGAALADPPPPSPFPDAVSANGSHLIDVRHETPKLVQAHAYSASMNRSIDLLVLRAADESKPAPTMYLLNGANGGTEGNWLDETDLVDFFKDKQVNVVIPIGGGGSYFTDWQRDDPLLGKLRWRTFLTEELPPVVDKAFNGNGTNSIAGLSMSGTSVFQLALAKPGLYQGLGSYSGCVRTSDEQGQAMVNAVVARQFGNASNMWGAPNDPAWAANDPYLHADELRGTSIYVSAGTGAPGPLDTLEGARGDVAHLAYSLLFGAPLEAVMRMCTDQLKTRFDDLAIPATFDLRPSGTHSWAYWEQDLYNSWPQFEKAMAAKAAEVSGAAGDSDKDSEEGPTG